MYRQRGCPAPPVEHGITDVDKFWGRTMRLVMSLVRKLINAASHSVWMLFLAAMYDEIILLRALWEGGRSTSEHRTKGTWGD